MMYVSASISVFFLLCSLPILCSGNLSSCSSSYCFVCTVDELNCSLTAVNSAERIYNLYCILPSECTRQATPEGLYYCRNIIHGNPEGKISVEVNYFQFNDVRDCSDVQPNCLDLYIEVPTIESFFNGAPYVVDCRCYEDNCQLVNNITIAVIDETDSMPTPDIIEVTTSLIPTHSGPDYGTTFIRNDISSSTNLVVPMSTTPRLSSLPSSMISPSSSSLSTTTASPSSIYIPLPSPSTTILILIGVLAFVLLFAVIFVVSLIVVLFFYRNRCNKRRFHSYQADLRVTSFSIATRP